ncbi:hypothetical protein [Schaalia cardiffensis]|uniref:hypothetical protein n=1 Tax=Schaalia cardiffensis TaxID=181487 RepID=UPI002AB13AE6|nr:hypothetical protein [Schaalia cardiffensis]
MPYRRSREPQFERILHPEAEATRACETDGHMTNTVLDEPPTSMEVKAAHRFRLT